MKKKLNITLPEELIQELKIYVLKFGNNNLSRLIEELTTDFLKEENKMRNELKVWKEDGYEVVEAHHNYDLHKFEVYQDDEMRGTIYPDDMETQSLIIKDLNSHICVDGWEDGNGETIRLVKYTVEIVDTKEDKAGTGTPGEMFSDYNYKDIKKRYHGMIWDKGCTLLLGKQIGEEWELLEEKSN